MRACLDGGGFADCYAVDVPGAVTHARFVEAFYSSGLFRVERAILAVVARRPSTDADVHALAAGASDRFAAWTVEARATDQLLLTDLHGSTRSWLMVAPGPTTTTLYFGSAVVPRRPRSAGEAPRMGWLFRLLLGFHGLYSRALLSLAARAV